MHVSIAEAPAPNLAIAEDQFAKVHLELNAHLYYGAAEARWLRTGLGFGVRYT